MTSQKVENLLNLALDATEEEREKSLQLDVGYNPIDRAWDLIVKYSGELTAVRNLADRVTELMNEYAVITINESRIEALAALPQIEYIEKPKRLFFQVTDGKRVSCIDEVQNARFSLFGKGVLVAVIDSGIDYMLADFRNADGTTRIRAVWDQSLRPREGAIMMAARADAAYSNNRYVRTRNSSSRSRCRKWQRRSKHKYFRLWTICRGCA